MDSAGKEGHAESTGKQGAWTPLAQRARGLHWKRKARSPLAQRRTDSAGREGCPGEAGSEEEGETEGEEEGEAEGEEEEEAEGRIREAESDRAATSWLASTRLGTTSRTVHLGMNLFPDEMRVEGLLPLPELIPEVQFRRPGELEETLRAIEDSVASLAERISDGERRGTHYPTCASFKENSFKSHTNAKGYLDAICCNKFLETLTREALSWFYELPSNSIDCFRQLADRFVNRFILQTDGQSTTQLFIVKQDKRDE
ncbi:hypothetical protein ACLB2K_020728 [Fragaria x ananassa]